MKSVFAFLASLLFALSVSAASPLITPADLQPLVASAAVRVIDIRDPKSYAAAHIPGALNAPYGSWRGPASSPGELPELAKLTAQVQRLGLTPATRTVVVSSGADATDFGAAARVYWTLKVLGLKELSVLNGGVKAWAAAGLPQDAPHKGQVADIAAIQLLRLHRIRMPRGQVVDDDGLPELGAQFLSKKTGNHIGRASRRVGHDNADGLVRVVILSVARAIDEKLAHE
jgi:rhodanese-related sulfurtransferase